jgi:hypothetical protein
MARLKTGDTKVIWIDRLAIVWLVVVTALLAILCHASPGVGLAGLASSGHFLAIAIVAGTPWLLLRGLWWAATGGHSR